MDLSAGTIVASLVTGTIGFGFFLYGKREARGPQLVSGMLLMAYPYFVAGPFAIWGIGAAILVGLGVALHFGL